jgi:hypothetical protein
MEVCRTAVPRTTTHQATRRVACHLHSGSTSSPELSTAEGEVTT